ncbi:MAG: efflux RND transporter permease subunit [Rickettsiales endosymbiont of Dermacentor nuttalli]
MLTLIGLAVKNAILIIEVVVLEMQEGTEIHEATRIAAKLRFRPIVMTSLEFILGCVPLFFKFIMRYSKSH